MDPIGLIGRVGERVIAAGSDTITRLSKLSAIVTSQVLGKYAESTQNLHTFHVSIAIAGVAPGTTLSTTPPFTIFNPLGSGINISVNQVVVGYVSGTLGAGSFVHAWTQQVSAPPTGGTELRPVAGMLAFSKSKFLAYTGATVANTPQIIRPSIGLGAGLATTPALPGGVAVDEVDGSIIIPPGTCYCIQGVAAAGTSPLVMISAHVEEIPL